MAWFAMEYAAYLRLKRVNSATHALISGIAVLESLTPASFGAFRSLARQ
jgi:hypothetical protein